MTEYSNADFISRIQSHQRAEKRKKYQQSHEDQQISIEVLEKDPTYHYKNEEQKRKLRAAVFSRDLNDFL